LSVGGSWFILSTNHVLPIARSGCPMEFTPEATPVSLLDRLRNPAEKDAWPRFVLLYTPLLFHWARTAGLQSQDAADLVQDVFTTLVQKMPTFVYDRHKSFRAWLRTVTLNKWRDRAKARGAAALDPATPPLADAVVEDPAEILAEAEYRRHLARRALELMQADFRPETWRACWLTVAEGRPAAGVAAELGLTVSAVYSANCRVLGRLRQELAGLFD
jgi:RNA polymerase sigma-70 factor, ECF subfamily